MKQQTESNPFSYFCMAFIAMSGLSYINFMPGLVNALAGGIGFGELGAGQIVALNGFGGLLGCALAIAVVGRVEWRRDLFVFLLMLTALDFSSAWVNDYHAMLGWRFAAGVLGGLCMGFGYSVLARFENPDRAFGSLLFIQFGMGSLVIYLLPGLEAAFTPRAVFFIMAFFLLLSLLFMRFLPEVSVGGEAGKPPEPLAGLRSNALLLMLAILGYQCAASGIWAYVGLMGLSAGFTPENVGIYIAITGLAGLFGALLPVVNGHRFGRMPWVMVGVMLSIGAAMGLNDSPLSPGVYIASMTLLFFSWPAVVSYLLAVTAEMDSRGRLSTIAALVSLAGLAAGPLIASSLLEGGDYSAMLYGCALIFLLSALSMLKPLRAHEPSKAPIASSPGKA